MYKITLLERVIMSWYLTHLLREYPTNSVVAQS